MKLFKKYTEITGKRWDQSVARGTIIIPWHRLGGCWLVKRRYHALLHQLSLGLLITLTGCGGSPDGLLLPVDVGILPGRRIDILVATTRSSIGVTNGQMFTGERGRGLAFADIAISIPPNGARQIGEVQLPDTAPGNPQKHFVTLSANRIDEAEALKRFHARIATTPKRRALVFVHGYNTSFSDAVFRFAQIVNDTNSPMVPILFTWPSRGKLLAYTYDRESANYSRDALESVLQSLAKDPSVGEIAILAHSMGNWVTLEALRQMAIRNKTLPKKMTNIMLAAPDVDFDVFRLQIASIQSSSQYPPVTLFVSQDDGALALSSRIWGSTARLGSINPQAEPYKAEIERAHINVIDLTDVKNGGILGHGKFAESPEIVQLIGRRLASGQVLSDDKSGFGDKVSNTVMSAAGVVGSAAGLVVSAPIAIVDRRTRDNLSDKFEELGTNATDLGRVVK